MEKKKLRLKKQTSNEPQWFFTHEGVDFGPMDDPELCDAADSGLLLPTDWVRRTDLTNPVPAGEIEGLFTAATLEEAERNTWRTETSDQTEVGVSAYEAGVVGSGSVTCIYCWYKFDPEHVLFVSRHPDLVGDPVLGPGEQQRFLPSRFTPEGHAIDSEGTICPEMACPRCHMRIPRSLLTMKPLFLSLVGAPASGKSYFLASMTWRLRTTLPEQFFISFSDADGAANQWLSDYEELLFVQPSPDAYASIDKTELRGHQYKEVVLRGLPTSLPMPSVFALQAEESSLFHQGAGHFVGRSLVLYDNAGEHFQPGADSATDPGTQHLLHAESILFMVDPTKSPSFRRVLRQNSDPQLTRTTIIQRQDTVFTETINRIRLHLGLDGRQKYVKPVVVLLAKADLLAGELSQALDTNPWKWDHSCQAHCLDVSTLMRISYDTRCLAVQHIPEVVKAVETFAQDVLYVPVSALGCSPVADPRHGEGVDTALLVVRAGDINPKWVEVPLLYILYRLGCVAGIADNCRDHPAPSEYEIRGGMYHFIIPGTTRRIRLPQSYASFSLHDSDTGAWFRVPDLPADVSEHGV